MQRQKSRTFEAVVAAVVGGSVGFAVPILFPELSQVVGISPGPLSISLAVLGIVAGGIAGARYPVIRQPAGRMKAAHDLKIPLREEQMDIVKDWVNLADMDIHKESVTDERTVTVPVTREELVIEKEMPGKIEPDDSIRIPLREEEVHVSKENRQLNDVSVYSNTFTTTETVEETLKKEKMTVGEKGENSKHKE